MARRERAVDGDPGMPGRLIGARGRRDIRLELVGMLGLALRIEIFVAEAERMADLVEADRLPMLARAFGDRCPGRIAGGARRRRRARRS